MSGDTFDIHDFNMILRNNIMILKVFNNDSDSDVKVYLIAYEISKFK